MQSKHKDLGCHASRTLRKGMPYSRDRRGLQGDEVDHVSGIRAKRGEVSVFITNSEEEMECLLQPLSAGSPTLHGTRGILVYHECNIGLSG
jgi:hypothetical protein